MDFIANQEEQVHEMLSAIGVDSVDALFSDIPQSLTKPPPEEDDGLSEYEGMKLMESLAEKNTFTSYDAYLGAGCYEHHVPPVVGTICQKSGFLTAYTPYQGEASQGTLQAIFEFQTAVAGLCGLDVANASLYDGATACAESLLMAMRAKPKKNKIILASTLHPHYRAVIDQYLARKDMTIVTLPTLEEGCLDLGSLDEIMDDSTAAILIQSPNFFGTLEDMSTISESAKKHGALTILSANPLSYGLFKSAREQGADIAIGDMQPLGLPMQFGGPHVGYLSCSKALTRQIPGRLVGRATDVEGKPCFVLTLQAREQHIRREKATSNICSNQALAALATLVGISWYGKEGMHRLALTNYQRSRYLREKLALIPGIEVITTGTCFNEFTIAFERPMSLVLEKFRKEKIQPGLPLGHYDLKRSQQLLVAVTETKSKEQLDRYIAVAKEAAR